MDTKECIVCGEQARHQFVVSEEVGRNKVEEYYECPHCGSFVISNSSNLAGVFKRDIEKGFLVRCYLNETKPKHDSHNPIRLSSDVINWIINQAPRTVEEKKERFLSYINDRTSFFGETIGLTKEVIYSNNEKELYNLGDALKG